MPDSEPIIIDRLSAVLRHGYAIVAECDRCQRLVYLNVPAVIALDGDRDRLDLQVRCRECGHRGTRQLVPMMPSFEGYPRWYSR